MLAETADVKLFKAQLVREGIQRHLCAAKGAELVGYRLPSVDPCEGGYSSVHRCRLLARLRSPLRVLFFFFHCVLVVCVYRAVSNMIVLGCVLTSGWEI